MIRWRDQRRITSGYGTTAQNGDMRSHRIEAAGAHLMFLPPYNRDFNPVDKAFARFKAMLRKAGERTVSGLWSLIGKLVDLFQPQERANYFSSRGYDAE